MVINKFITLSLGNKKFFFRPIIPSDKTFVKMGFKELSPKTKYLRFFAHQNELSEAQLQYFTELDNKDHVAWGIMDVTNFGATPVGIGRFVRMKTNPKMAEVAITIVDAYQRMGLGRVMIAILNIIGYKLGIREFRYHVLPENIKIMESLIPFSERKKSADHNVLMLDSKLFPKAESIKITDKTRKFVDIMKRVELKLYPQLSPEYKL